MYKYERGLYNPFRNMTEADNTKVTITEYTEFQDAFDWFNTSLFDGSLPEALVTLQRKSRSRGYFHAERFASRADQQNRVAEIALNPDCFQDRTDTEILSTLVHEMCHLWRDGQHKTRNGYHDKGWGSKMKEVGLYPSSTAAVGGKETGYRVSHYILPNGRFASECRAFLNAGHRLIWQSQSRTKTKVNNTRQKYQCRLCGLSAWAKPNAQLLCGDCEGVAMAAVR